MKAIAANREYSSRYSVITVQVKTISLVILLLPMLQVSVPTSPFCYTMIIITPGAHWWTV